MSLDNHIKELRRRHAALSEQITALEKERGHCSLSVQALKKQKCALKTEIARLEGDITQNPQPTAEAETGESPETKEPEPPVSLVHHTNTIEEISEPSLPGQEPIGYNNVVAAE